MARILAIDYGGKRCGLATTDPMQIIATPIGYKPTDELMAFLKEYLAAEEVETLVLGYPLRSDGTDTHATPLIRKFIDQFKKEFPSKPIVLQDESYTSVQAAEALVLGGMKKKKRREKGQIDAVAATLILKAYLENR